MKRLWRRVAPYQKQLTPAALLLGVYLVRSTPLHAAGLDWSDLQAFGQSAEALGLYLGALLGVIGIVFGAMKLIGRDYTEGIIGILAGAGVFWACGHAVGWGTAITGQQL
jgi:hypothetical protein